MGALEETSVLCSVQITSAGEDILSENNQRDIDLE